MAPLGSVLLSRAPAPSMKPYSYPTRTPASAAHAAISSPRAWPRSMTTTGEVRVLRLVQAYDVGRAINPTLVEGQIEGGGIMGLGLAMLEAATRTTRPSSTAGASFGASSRAGIGEHAGGRTRSSSRTRRSTGLRREGDQRDGQQRPGARHVAASMTRSACG